MIQGLGEAHLLVSNLEKSIAFYEKLGLNLAWKDDYTAFFGLKKEKTG